MLALAAGAAGQLTETERRGILDVLSLGNLNARDLEYEREPFADPLRLPLIRRAIQKPLETADELMLLHGRTAGRTGAGALALAISTFGDPAVSTAGAMTPATVLDGVPAPLRPAIARLATLIELANSEIRLATKDLTPDQRRALLETLPQWAVEEPSVRFSFVRRPSLSQSQTLALLAKIDLPRIRAVGLRLAQNVESELDGLRSVARSIGPLPKVKTRLGGVTIEIGGTGNDTYDDDGQMLAIDLGGDDVWSGRYGAGPGYAGVQIDLGGNDRYDAGDLAFGAGLMGVGLSYDLAGSDVRSGASLTYGAGLAGVGLVEDRGGNDVVRSATLSQGFGQFGVGVYLDTSGNDVYAGQLFVQGAARTQGVGWLIDQAGGDMYRAGGRILNSPLFADAHYSFAQGFASGYREDTGGPSGGIGLLTDLEGDDGYVSETYAQAASYWFSLGSLYDGKGNDAYSGTHYVQASAMHATAAYLFDLAGDDLYAVRVGAAQAIGHDDGLAFLLDRAGGDVYLGRDSRPGIGNANGLGLFVDAAGEDRYWGPPGVGNPSRGSGSLGIFADLDGPDRYAAGLSDGEAAVKGTWGIAYDRDAPSVGSATTPVAPAPIAPPTPGTETMPSDAQMEQLYRQATQWGVGTAQAEVAAAVRRLTAIGMPAVKWMLERKLATANRLQIRAFVAVINGVGPDARAALAPYVGDKNPFTARVALRIAVDARVTEAAPFLPAALAVPELQRAAATAAGALGGKESVPALMPLAAAEDRMLARNAVLALAEIGDEAAFSTGEILLSSADLPIRKAAIRLVARFPLRATALADRMLDETDERRVRTGLEVLAEIGGAEALSRIARRLDDPRAGVKIQAMLGLDGRVPAANRATLAALRNDPDPKVRAVAARIDPGR